MRGAIIHAPGDVRYDERADPTIVERRDGRAATSHAALLTG